MFTFKGKLEHLLCPGDYYSLEIFQEELSKVFSQCWVPLCLWEDVSKSGERFAGQIANKPVVVVNENGSVKAFSNVCGHRHSLICPLGRGAGERLKCQIHGWEYDCDGNLSKIPDGKHFKVVKPGDFSLTTYRAQRLGPFVFVNLAPEGPSLESHFGSLVPEYEYWYGNVRLIHVWSQEHDVNWKIPVENAVESYHVPMIHPQTFQDYRDESLHDHRLEPTYTRYGDLLPYEGKAGFVSRAMSLYTKVLIKQPTFERFTHTHVFPSMMLYYGDIYRSLNYIEPLSPTRFRTTCYGFVPTGIRFGVLGKVLQDLSMIVFKRMGRKITSEDAAYWPSVQAGLKSSTHQGVISAREERVYAFQKWLRGILDGEGARKN